MASRSTRNKVRWQAKKILDNINRIYEHLKYIDELAQGQSEYINENLPRLVKLFDGVESIITQFYEGL